MAKKKMKASNATQAMCLPHKAEQDKQFLSSIMHPPVIGSPMSSHDSAMRMRLLVARMTYILSFGRVVPISKYCVCQWQFELEQIACGRAVYGMRQSRQWQEDWEKRHSGYIFLNRETNQLEILS